MRPRAPEGAPRFEVRPAAGPEDWQEAARIREEVFIGEQGCPPEEEWDAYDASSRHFLGLLEGRPVATARWRAVGEPGAAPPAKLERFAVRAEARGQGLGRLLVAYVAADAERAGFRRLRLHAQAHLEGFYAGLGFRRAPGPPFYEAGILHVRMERDVEGG